jgi:hypothetical protein
LNKLLNNKLLLCFREFIAAALNWRKLFNARAPNATGVDAPQWPDLLDFFCRAFVARWVLVFTTLERQPIQWMRESFFDYGLSREEQRTLIEGYVKQGFGFVSPSNQAFR